LYIYKPFYGKRFIIMPARAGMDTKIAEKLNALNLPKEVSDVVAAIVAESSAQAIQDFSDRVVKEVGFAGKIALVPQDKYEYLQSNIRALTKVLLEGK
jgi:hypothetical protein